MVSRLPFLVDEARHRKEGYKIKLITKPAMHPKNLRKLIAELLWDMLEYSGRGSGIKAQLWII